MIREIVINGKILTADYLLELGLPPCLHDCLDGTRLLYQENKGFFGDGILGELGWAIERVLRFPSIEDTLATLKVAFLDYQKWEEGEKKRLGIESDGPQDNFLVTLLYDLFWALKSAPTLNLTQKQIDENLDSSKRAVRVLTDSPINGHLAYNRPLDILFHLIGEKSREPDLYSGSVRDSERVFEALARLRKELHEAGIDFTFGELLDCWVSVLPTRQERGVSRPGRGDAAKRYFCVVLADKFGLWTKKCVYPQVANLATAVFSDTSEDYVRKAHKRAQT